MRGVFEEAKTQARQGNFALARSLYRRALHARPELVCEELGLAAAMDRHGRPFIPFGLRIRQREHAWFNPTSVAIGHRHGCFERLPEDAPERRWRCCPHWPRKYELDKLMMRALGQRNGVPVPDLIWAGTDIDAIPFGRLPDRHVCKLTHGARGSRVLLVQGPHATVALGGETVTRADIAVLLKRWLDTAPPAGKVLIETMQENEVGGPARASDFRMYVFGGRVAMLSVNHRDAEDRDQWRPRFYTRNWFELPWPVRTPAVRYLHPLPPPACLDVMIEHAERLGETIGVPARIDMYATPAGPVLGEITNHPSNGNGFTPAGERLLGELWEIFEHGPAAPRFPAEVSGRELVIELARRARRRFTGG